LNVDRVNQILELNRSGKKPASLELDVAEEKPTFNTLNSDLDRMDKKYQGKSRKKKKRRNNRGNNRNQRNKPTNKQ
jgi:hypothetical protein